ncbi:outer membrane beta-barrel protein [uncultured Dokdonia sp.]|uniref:outer membrane beta-barrel protein n=1 Tax=uncultured Dokdonia sp. TaxID=575653 RepID=UPI00262431E5|nr:outer membrane beta-barrel protein [uncultured Dokdonia sp.]
MKSQRIVLLISLFLSCTVFAQLEKGDQLFSIAFAPYPTTSNGEKDFGVIAKADAEFLFTNRFSLVTSAFYSNNTTFNNASDISFNAFGVIPSLQYYFVNKEKWTVYGLVGYGFGFTDRSFRSSENSAITVGALGAGAHYKIGDKWYLKLQLPYFKAQNISFDFTEVEGVAPFIGVSYLL